MAPHHDKSALAEKKDCLGPASVPSHRSDTLDQCSGVQSSSSSAGLSPPPFSSWQTVPAERTVSVKSLNGIFGFVRPSAP